MSSRAREPFVPVRCIGPRTLRHERSGRGPLHIRDACAIRFDAVPKLAEWPD